MFVIFRVHCLLVATAVLSLLPAGADARAGELSFGAAGASITPDGPVALQGQMHTRISKGVRSPVTATALALESRQGDKVLDQAILVSCDLVAVSDAVLERTRALLRDRIPDFEVKKLVISATHTHTAPVYEEGNYLIPKEVAIRPAAYAEFLSDRIANAAVDAWRSRKPGRVGWGLGHAVVAQNRRALFDDGTAAMYGATDAPRFRGIEGPEDQGVEVLFFWNGAGELIATAVNVACPSQEVEGDSQIDADFWHEVRQGLRAKHGEKLQVLAWTGAAGDQSPHLMYRKRAEERMRSLRKVTRLQEIAGRIVAAWEEAHDGAKQEKQADPVLVHRFETLELPPRLVTDEEAAKTRQEIETLSKDPKNYTMVEWHRKVLDRHERQRTGKLEPYYMELHVVRLGDVAIATNPFELYTQYGIQMKSRSRAIQTFVVQLAGPGTYLPTAVAVRGGGYSAIVASGVVGPEGGQMLVDRTVELIDLLWTTK